MCVDTSTRINVETKLQETPHIFPYTEEPLPSLFDIDSVMFQSEEEDVPDTSVALHNLQCLLDSRETCNPSELLHCETHENNALEKRQEKYVHHTRLHFQKAVSAKNSLSTVEEECNVVSSCQRPTREMIYELIPNTRARSLIPTKEVLASISFSDFSQYLTMVKAYGKATNKEIGILKENRRMIRNRESSTASRKRKKREFVEMQERIRSLVVENRIMFKRIQWLESTRKCEPQLY